MNKNKRLKFKTLLAIALLISGVLGAWLIGKNPTNNQNQPLVKTMALNGGNTDLKFDVQSLNNNLVSPSQNQSQEQTNNLTDNLAQLYTREVSNRNASGPTTAANGQQQLTVPSQDVFANLLQTSLEQKISFPAFSASDIRLVSDNSVAAQLAYIQAFQTITKRNFGSNEANVFTALDRFFNNQDPSPLQKQIDLINKQIQDLLALATPSLWQPFQLQTLNLWQKNLAINQAVLSLNDDPLKTYLVLNDFADIFQEFTNLTMVLNNRYQELITKS